MILKSCFILVVIQTDEVPYETTPVMQLKSKLIDIILMFWQFQYSS